MTLIDRYLHAVRSFLPPADQDDIVRELSEDLHAQIADKEAEAGRPLREAEIRTVLQQFGHPMVLAARYRPNRYVVGPTLFPVYWQVLKVGLLGALIVHAALGVAMIASGEPVQEIIDLFVRFPFTVGVTVFGWVTLAFAVIDMNLTHVTWLRSWDPDKLPIPTPRAPQSRLALLGESLWSTAVMIWWLALPRFPFLVFGPASSFLALAPSWHRLYLLIGGLWALTVVVLWMMLLRPGWERFRVGASLFARVVGLLCAALLLRATPLVVLGASVSPPDNAAAIVRVVNMAVQFSLAAFLAVSMWEVVRELWRLRRASTTRERTT
jgi:hypothetical protein